MDSYIVGFTETLPLETDNISHDILFHFHIVTNNANIDHFLNIGFALRDSLSLVVVGNIPTAALFQVSKPTFLSSPVDLLLAYRRNTLKQEDFIYLMQLYLSRTKKVHVIFGDFNINSIRGSNYVSEFLSCYQMIVTSATHISGSLVDHIHILKELYETVSVISLIKCVYFSNHEAIKVLLGQRK